MSDEQSKPDKTKIEVEIEINAPQEHVWQAITDAEELTRWFPLDASVDPKPGGAVQWKWGDYSEWSSRIEVWEPHTHLRLTYDNATDHSESAGDEIKTDSSSEAKRVTKNFFMDFYLESKGGATMLRLVHSGFGVGEDWDEIYDAYARGWQTELKSLRHYLENHRGTPRQAAFVHYPLQKISREEAWQRLMGANGLLQQSQFKNLTLGGRYSLHTTTGDSFEGVVLKFTPPKDFAGTIENLNNGIFRVQTEELYGHRDMMIKVSTYGLPKKEVDALEKRMKKVLQAVES